MELEAARTVFAQLGAAPDLARWRHSRTGRPPKAHGLTEQSCRCLRLVATGATNHAIASQLFVAEKTVDRHVSNIFTQLGVSSRAAATRSPTSIGSSSPYLGRTPIRSSPHGGVSPTPRRQPVPTVEPRHMPQNGRTTSRRRRRPHPG